MHKRIAPCKRELAPQNPQDEANLSMAIVHVLSMKLVAESIVVGKYRAAISAAITVSIAPCLISCDAIAKKIKKMSTTIRAELTL